MRDTSSTGTLGDSCYLQFRMFFMVLLYSCLTDGVGSVEIVRSPVTVSNATIGGTARFECILSTATFNPNWNINGIDYAPVHIPNGYTYTSNSNSYYLTVISVQEYMNNSCFYCYLQFLTGDRVNSDVAKLIIPPPVTTPRTTNQQQLTTSSKQLLTTHQVSTLVSLSSPSTLISIQHTTLRITKTLSTKNYFKYVEKTLDHLHPLETFVVSSTSAAINQSQPFLEQDKLNIIDYSTVATFAGIAVIICSTIIIIIVTVASIFFYRKRRKHGNESNVGQDHIYEVVSDPVSGPVSDNLQENVAYEILKTRMEPNPAYEVVELSNSGYHT